MTKKDAQTRATEIAYKALEQEHESLLQSEEPVDIAVASELKKIIEKLEAKFKRLKGDSPIGQHG